MKRITVLLLALSAGLTAFTQGTMLLRQPSISNDNIVFVYANDLWSCSINGGDAHRLTSSVGAETSPHFSPDGKLIAFTGQYDGNNDVYLIPVEGGEAKRLTWHPGTDEVQGWTPDGKSVVFRSGREGRPSKANRLYSISVDDGMPVPLPVVRSAYGELSSDGKYLAYTPITLWDSEWRNYRGGQAQPVWIVNLETMELQQTPRSDNERHMDPVWLDKKVFFVSERDYTANIWSYDIETDELKQHTHHVQFDVKSIDAGNDKIIYEQGGRLHILNPMNDETSTLEINVRGDFHWARIRWEEVNPASLMNAKLSATGKRALFEYRGEIMSVPAEKGSWKNLTNSPGAADRYPAWSPRGDKIAWFNDESGEYRLVVSGQDGLSGRRTYPIPEASFFFRPAWSPDAKYIAFTDTHYKLHIINLETGNVKIADSDTYAHPNRTMNPVWSPDSKWIAYAKILGNQYKAVFVYNVENGEKHQLTDGMADALSPVWDESGKYLYFLASTNYGLASGWLDMSGYDVVTTRSVYMAVLSDETDSPFLPESDKETAPDDESGKDKSKGKKDSKNKKEQEQDDVKVDIDPEGIEGRILAIDMPDKNYTSLLPGPENSVFIMEMPEGQRTAMLHKYDIKKQERIDFLEKVSAATISPDRKKILFRTGNAWTIESTAAPVKGNSKGKLDLAGMKIKIDPKLEWQQIFTEGWRYQRDFLYVDNVHGAPWNEIYNWYKPWVKHVRHRSDLNYIIDILGGEVAVGHSFTRGGDFPDVERVPVGLLGADIWTKDGVHFIKKIYDGESWNPGYDAPLAQPGLEVEEGDNILAVNGKNIKPGDNIYRYFEGTAGLHTTITLADNPEGDNSHEIMLIPVSNESRLRTADWVESNRRLVDRLSDGRLAYVWLPNTGRGGFNNFNRYYFAQQDRKGAIIDERNNGGGSAADYIIDILSRELLGYFNSKTIDRRPFTTPMAGLWGPKVMIINEMAGSGGDLMPYMFREKNIGPLIGTRTWGGLVGTWDTPPFIDGGRMVAPRGGFFDTDGEWAVEAEGVAPDIHVMQDPAAEAKGNDPQLLRAVEEALKLLETEGVELKKEPEPPVRWKRPGKF
ncbi:MAG: PDZ domain-containing protein [Bacteroidales bacterium]|nr:PDZ domain-containing protein [Bacteroidales bacterium]